MGLKKIILYHFNSFVDILFPRTCVVCGKVITAQEMYICTKCIYELPRVNNCKFHNNPIYQQFFGRLQIENATSLFFYDKESAISNLLYAIKYNGMKEFAEFLGCRLGRVLKESLLYEDVDLIIPVPLHARKYRMRGYNQSEWIVRGIASVLGKDYSVNHLYRNEFTKTQTKKNRVERWENVRNKFGVMMPDDLQKKHILLVDDVLTTGATLEACGEILLKIEGVKLSIATLAKA